MRDSVRNFLVGIASIGAVLGLIALLLLFGELDDLVRPRYLLTINTDHAAGLRPGSSVELNGVPIGMVNEITVTGGGAYPVQVTASIDRAVRIPANARPFAAASLLGGASLLQLEAQATPKETGFFPPDGSAIINAPIPFRMIEQITAELDKRMEQIGEALDQRMTSVYEALDDFKTLSDTYTEVGANLNTLFGPIDENVPADQPQANLRAVVKRLDEVLISTQDALQLAKLWLNDEKLREDAKTAVANASTLIDKTAQTLERYTQLAGSLEADADQLTERLLPVADELATTLSEVRRLTHAALEGEGTVAMLLKNPDLYNSLDDAAVRLEQALKDLRLFIQKAQAEGVPVQY